MDRDRPRLPDLPHFPEDLADIHVIAVVLHHNKNANEDHGIELLPIGRQGRGRVGGYRRPGHGIDR